LLTEEGHEPNLEQLTEAISTMDEMNAWQFDSKVKQILGKLNIHNLDQPVGAFLVDNKKESP